jgi:hypothetical protein
VTNALAIVAVLISTGAGVIALLARSDSRSQARTAAESLAELRTQQHEAYRPLQPCDPEFVAEPHPRTGKDSLFFVSPRRAVTGSPETRSMTSEDRDRAARCRSVR